MSNIKSIEVRLAITTGVASLTLAGALGVRQIWERMQSVSPAWLALPALGSGWLAFKASGEAPKGTASNTADLAAKSLKTTAPARPKVVKGPVERLVERCRKQTRESQGLSFDSLELDLLKKALPRLNKRERRNAIRGGLRGHLSLTRAKKKGAGLGFCRYLFDEAQGEELQDLCRGHQLTTLEKRSLSQLLQKRPAVLERVCLQMVDDYCLKWLVSLLPCKKSTLFLSARGLSEPQYNRLLGTVIDCPKTEIDSLGLELSPILAERYNSLPKVLQLVTRLHRGGSQRSEAFAARFFSTLTTQQLIDLQRSPIDGASPYTIHAIQKSLLKELGRRVQTASVTLEGLPRDVAEILCQTPASWDKTLPLSPVILSCGQEISNEQVEYLFEAALSHPLTRARDLKVLLTRVLIPRYTSARELSGLVTRMQGWDTAESAQQEAVAVHLLSQRTLAELLQIVRDSDGEAGERIPLGLLAQALIGKREGGERPDSEIPPPLVRVPVPEVPGQFGYVVSLRMALEHARRSRGREQARMARVVRYHTRSCALLREPFQDILDDEQAVLQRWLASLQVLGCRLDGGPGKPLDVADFAAAPVIAHAMTENPTWGIDEPRVRYDGEGSYYRILGDILSWYQISSSVRRGERRLCLKNYSWIAKDFCTFYQPVSLSGQPHCEEDQEMAFTTGHVLAAQWALRELVLNDDSSPLLSDFLAVSGLRRESICYLACDVASKGRPRRLETAGLVAASLAKGPPGLLQQYIQALMTHLSAAEVLQMVPVKDEDTGGRVREALLSLPLSPKQLATIPIQAPNEFHRFPLADRRGFIDRLARAHASYESVTECPGTLLDILPLELWVQIIDRLPVNAQLAFRTASKQAKFLQGSCPTYQRTPASRLHAEYRDPCARMFVLRIAALTLTPTQLFELSKSTLLAPQYVDRLRRLSRQLGGEEPLSDADTSSKKVETSLLPFSDGVVGNGEVPIFALYQTALILKRLSHQLREEEPPTDSDAIGKEVEITMLDQAALIRLCRERRDFLREIVAISLNSDLGSHYWLAQLGQLGLPDGPLDDLAGEINRLWTEDEVANRPLFQERLSVLLTHYRSWAEKKQWRLVVRALAEELLPRFPEA